METFHPRRFHTFQVLLTSIETLFFFLSVVFVVVFWFGVSFLFLFAFCCWLVCVFVSILFVRVSLVMLQHVVP